MRKSIIFCLLIPIALLSSCTINKAKDLYIDKEEVLRVEIKVNDFTIPLDSVLIKDFINDFNKCKHDHSVKSVVYNLDLNIYKKNDDILYFKSNGNNEYVNKSKIFECKENLILKYWKINEENIPLLKPPKSLK
jgi:hypothetical protein